MNKLILSGTIAKAPKAQTVGERNTPLTTFQIAFESTGRTPEQTKQHWITCKVWGKRAEFFATLPEGTELIAEGQLQEERWKDKQGNWQGRYVLNPNDIQLVGGGS